MLRWICEGFLTVTASTTSSSRKIRTRYAHLSVTSYLVGLPLWTAREVKRHFSQSLTVLVEGGLKVFKDLVQFGSFDCFGAKDFDSVLQFSAESYDKSDGSQPTGGHKQKLTGPRTSRLLSLGNQTGMKDIPRCRHARISWRAQQRIRQTDASVLPPHELTGELQYRGCVAREAEVGEKCGLCR
jgi:hypothetical protein